MNRNIIFLFFFLACTNNPGPDEAKTETSGKADPIKSYKRASGFSQDSVKKQGFLYIRDLSQLVPDENGFIEVDSIRIKANQVTHIHLADEGVNNRSITEFPFEVFHLQNLEYLWVGMRGFEELPPEISKLKKLKELDLQHGVIKRLPENIHELENLENLCLLGSGIESLPDNLRLLTNLKELHIGLTGLEELPSVLFEMKQLDALILAHFKEVDGKELILDPVEVDSLRKSLPETYIRHL